MALIDWIPIAGTIKNALADPKGRKASDYTCNMDTSACGTGGQRAAILECERDIKKQMLKFIDSFVGGGVLDPYVGAAVSGTLAALMAVVLKRLIAMSASRAAVAAAGGATAVLAIDAFVNLYITISKLNEIKVAAQLAMSTCCSCSQPKCGSTTPVATGDTIDRWFWGAERSFKKTTEAMQEKAKADYKHACSHDCADGTCTPVAYVTEWSQYAVGMHKTTLTYSVYCECVK